MVLNVVQRGLNGGRGRDAAALNSILSNGRYLQNKKTSAMRGFPHGAKTRGLGNRPAGG